MMSPFLLKIYFLRWLNPYPDPRNSALPQFSDRFLTEYPNWGCWSPFFAFFCLFASDLDALMPWHPFVCWIFSHSIVLTTSKHWKGLLSTMCWRVETKKQDTGAAYHCHRTDFTICTVCLLWTQYQAHLLPIYTPWIIFTTTNILVVFIVSEYTYILYVCIFVYIHIYICIMYIYVYIMCICLLCIYVYYVYRLDR